MPSQPPTIFSFRPHGEFISRVEGRLMITELTGPWNKELVEHWALAANPIAKSLGVHIGIAVIRESMLSTPDALLVLQRAAEHAARSLSCLAHVIVADKTVEGRDFVESSFLRIYQGVLPLAFFYTLDEARAWSLARLAGEGL